MRELAIVLLGSLVLLFAISSSALPPNHNTSVLPAGTAIVHDTAYIESGELLMMVNNNGSFAYDRTALFGKSDGLHFPGVCPQTVMFAAGLWLGAKVGSEIRVSAAEYAYDFRPGTMTGGAASPDDPRFRVYKIRRGDTRASNPDYLEWPYFDGAPTVKDFAGVDSLDDQGFRIPLLLGDEAVWTVFNDAGMSAHDSDPGSGSSGPLGIEAQLYAYAYDSTGDAGRIIFMIYTLINKGTNQLDSMHVAFWADPDVGYAGDDFVGCDTTINLGYSYNASAADALYGENPPAVGFAVLGGESKMTAFSKYINGIDPSSASESWNYMKGLNLGGDPYINPATGLATTYAVSGDPVTATGDLDNNAADRRYMATQGPSVLRPGDTLQVALAVLVGSTIPRDCLVSIFVDTVHAIHTTGTGVGGAYALVLDPDSTTGHEYQISFTGPPDDIRWNLYDLDLNQLLFSGLTDLKGTDDNSPQVDGLMVKVIGYTPGVESWEVPSGTRRFTWAGADAFNFEGFNGAIGWESPCHFFGICGEQGVSASRLRRVVLKCADVNSDGSYNPDGENVSYAYRYMRSAQLPPARPEFAPFISNAENYGYQSFEKSVPLSAWDVDSDPPRRLAMGFLENNVGGGLVDGTYWPPLTGIADNVAGTGPREWLWVFDVDYSEEPDPEYQVSALTNQLPVMYFSTMARRMEPPYSTDDHLLIIPTDSTWLFSEADTFQFVAPLPGGGGTLASATFGNLESVTNLRRVDSLAQAMFLSEHGGCIAPETPGAPSVSDTLVCPGAVCTVSWDATGGPFAVYDLYENDSLIRTTFDTLAQVHLSAGTYEYHLVVRNLCGSSSPGPSGPSIAVMIPPSSPSAPSVSDTFPCSNENYAVTWRTVPGANRYNLYQNGFLIASGPDTSYTFSYLAGSFAYSVWAGNNCGSGSYGPTESLTIAECYCHGDPVCDGMIVDVLDVLSIIGIAFSGEPLFKMQTCPKENTDLDCNGYTDLRDVVTAIDIAFRGASPEVRICDPCP
jgi:hypothetical protein